VNDGIELLFDANGEVPLGEDLIVVRISEPSGLVYTWDFTIPITISKLVVTIIPSQLVPGDTADVSLFFKADDGQLIEFPDYQDFDLNLIEGSEIGTILLSDGVTTGSTFFTEPAGFKIIANENITGETTQIRLKVRTFYFNFPFKPIIVGEENKKVSTSDKQMDISNTANKKLATSAKRKKKKDKVEFIFGEEISGIGVAEIKSGGCEPKCIGETLAPNILVSANYTDGFKGHFYCDKKSNRLGIFIPLGENNEETYEPYSLGVCFNKTTENWQIRVNNNAISIRAIKDICVSENVIMSIEEIDDITPEELCDALYSFRGHRNYPISYIIGYEKYYISAAMWQHETEHENDFKNKTMKTVLGDKIILENQIYKNFNTAIKSFNLSCSEESDSNKVKIEAEKFYDDVLDKFRDNMIREFNRVNKRTDENKIQSRDLVQKIVEKYINALEKRISSLNKKC